MYGQQEFTHPLQDSNSDVKRNEGVGIALDEKATMASLLVKSGRQLAQELFHQG